MCSEAMQSAFPRLSSVRTGSQPCRWDIFALAWFAFNSTVVSWRRDASAGGRHRVLDRHVPFPRLSSSRRAVAIASTEHAGALGTSGCLYVPSWP